MARSRNFMWTLNNYSNEEQLEIQALDYKYLCYGYEVGAENNTPHLQGVIIMKNPKTVSSMIKLMPKRVANIQIIARLEESIAYSKKDGNYFEDGIAPATQKEKGQREIERWERARNLAKENKLDEIDADIYLRMYRTLKEVAKDHMPQVASIDQLSNEWICGPTGCGKTRGVLARYPDAYLKTANKWWDGYQGEETVLIDDLDESHKCLSHHLKIWGDHKPFLAETKGGMIKIRPKRIICTSNIRLSDFGEGEHLHALERRYEVTDHFNPNYSSNFNQ